MDIAILPEVVFLLLFISYAAQMFFIFRRLRGAAAEEGLAQIIGDLWVYMAMSLVVPLLVGFLPELLGQAIQAQPSNSIVPDSPFIFVGVRFLIAYLITIITLELALQAQELQSNTKNPWRGLLLVNLGFDIASVLVFQIFKFAASGRSDVVVAIFFAICAIPTILTGTVVVAGSYAALTRVRATS
jgi:hypothetical protein